MTDNYSRFLDELETSHTSRLCTDPDCWCHDPEYWDERLGEE